MTVGSFGTDSHLPFGRERLQKRFTTYYTRFPQPPEERIEHFIPNVGQSVNNIISKVHTHMKPVPAEQKTGKRRSRARVPKTVQGYKPTDEEIRSIELKAERLSTMAYKQRKEILDMQIKKDRQKAENTNTNLYEHLPLMPNPNSHNRKEKPSIPQVKASLMIKKQINKRRLDPIYDWEAQNYRRDQELKLNASKNLMNEMLCEFERLKENHEGLSHELGKIRNNLANLDDRLTATMLNTIPNNAGTKIIARSVPPSTDKGNKKKKTT